MRELKLTLTDEIIKKIESYSKEYHISNESICEMILDAWSNHGGLIWSGDYEKSQAFLIDWPSTRKLKKLIVNR